MGSILGRQRGSFRSPPGTVREAERREKEMATHEPMKLVFEFDPDEADDDRGGVRENLREALREATVFVETLPDVSLMELTVKVFGPKSGLAKMEMENYRMLPVFVMDEDGDYPVTYFLTEDSTDGGMMVVSGEELALSAIYKDGK